MLFFSENVVFVLEFCVLIVEDRSILGSYSFTFGTLLNSGVLRSGFRKCRFCLRRPFARFYLRKRFVFRDLGGRCVPPSRAIRAEYCIVGIPHDTAM